MRSGKARAIVCLSAAGGLATLAAAAWALAASAGIEIRVVPDRAHWRPGETITGRVVVASTWPWPVELGEEGITRVGLVGLDGQEVKKALGYYLSSDINLGEGILGVRPPRLSPFSEFVSPFQIGTEPLAAAGGYVLDDGPYFLEVDPPQLEVPCRLRRARIEVRGTPGEDQRSRIILAAAGGNRLNLVRWDGGIESRDLDSGEPIAAFEAGGPFLELVQCERVCFSPDGTTCALLRATTFTGAVGPTVEFHPLGVGMGRSLAIGLPRAGFQEPRRVRLLDFDAGSRHLRIAGSDHFWEIDRSTGALSIIPAGNFPAISPDGEFIVDIEKETTVVYPRHGQRPRVLEAPSGSDPGARLIGRVGIYLGSREQGIVRLVSYAGKLLAEFRTRAAIPRGESSDGSLVLLSTTSLYEWIFKELAGRLEIWDVVRQSRVAAVEDGKHRACWFAGSPPKLICAAYRRGVGGAFWLGDVFEVRDPATGELLRTIDASRGRRGAGAAASGRGGGGEESGGRDRTGE